jgi:DNA invertase Pin-like site-specific DNA recombinase
VLVVSRLDRLTRSLLDFSALVERAQRERWRLVVVEQAFDLGTSSGRAMAGMLAVFAQFERDLISERIREALAVKRSQGVRLGRPPVLDGQVKRRIRGLRTRGWSYRAIAELLNTERVPTGHGGVAWWPTTVKRAIEQGGWEPRRRG